MLSGYTIRKCAEECQINIATSFFWRHKISDASATTVGVGDLEGLIEADETFFRYILRRLEAIKKQFLPQQGE